MFMYFLAIYTSAMPRDLWDSHISYLSSYMLVGLCYIVECFWNILVIFIKIDQAFSSRLLSFFISACFVNYCMRRLPLPENIARIKSDPFLINYVK